MDMSDKIKEWVAVDNRIRGHNEQLREQRTVRKLIGQEILSTAEKNNMTNAVIQITDGKLKFQECRVVAPLTFKFLKSCLSDCIESEEQVKQIMEYIKEKREIRYIPEIKRFYTEQ